MFFLERGFELSEFETRTSRAQETMHEHQLDAIFLTTEPNIRYFSGFFTSRYILVHDHKGLEPFK